MSRPCHEDAGIDNNGLQSVELAQFPPYQECNPRFFLNNLAFLRQKVHDLQGVVRSMCIQGGSDVAAATRRQLVVAEIGSIIAQMISMARRLLHTDQQIEDQNARPEVNTVIVAHLSNLLGDTMGLGAQDLRQIKGKGSADGTNIDPGHCDRLVEEEKLDNSAQEVESGSSTDADGEGEEEKVPSPGYEVLELHKEEILALNTHFCLICGKGFKRDANLRMHMRGHGDKFKTPEALANPNKRAKLELVQPRRYSCPFEGCKRNQKHEKFRPLKTILCVKNHYRRSHCDKSYICSICNRKKFSVASDLKTHEKHCGKDDWKCSCGTSFTRKDKLFSHVALFHDHTPLPSMDKLRGCRISDKGPKVKTKETHVGVSSTTPSRSSGFNSIVISREDFVPDQPVPPMTQSLLLRGFTEPDGTNSTSE
ncbi:PREDICTED: zinc finger protein STOP1 homolog [Nelumbo nucifera]|uniref:Zinc finger protein STOP1 homolog n=2 Tax=Nelumbo nucifera TaxID=4432 RepID=A0A1U7Z7M8_NELNU|nr:PREDICTED: zinc finger protein STOP1 homolog [Nelumbo nucifera]DAD46986.1 TPA_asm: hypothetical protein HUJ06_016923 [Nelumbo nucifera]